MRRLGTALVATSLAGALFAATGPAQADEPPMLVAVCHVTGASDPIPTFSPSTDSRMFYPGIVISVAEPAVDAHLAHGDSATPGFGNGEYRTDAQGLANLAKSADDNDLRFWSDADCFVTRLP